VEARKAEIDARINPNEKKIDVCIDLINYCIRRKPKATKEETKQPDYMNAGRKNIDQMLSQGNIVAAVPAK